MRLSKPGLTTLCFALTVGLVDADPCGMVPPIWEGQGPAITRVGEQLTYVFYKDGIESFVIRPSFSGKVDEFGMLIPFPTPPALRKVDDGIFGQIANAIDPPEVVVQVWQEDWLEGVQGAAPLPSAPVGLSFEEEEKRVTVIKEEAVGMYQVVVLDAGSATALTRWLDDHGYQYPPGMDAVAQDYVDLGWCFVAIKTQVGAKRGVTPRAGMTDVEGTLPEGAVFDGNVQAMGFRFETPELVVPMRLSAFNAGKLHNIVYLLTDRPMRITDLDEALVVRQLSGEELHANLTEPLPLRVVGGSYADIPDHELVTLPQRRDPVPHNGLARDLFAGDLLSVRLGKLALPHEEKEKVLLRIGERLGLRGEEIDSLHRETLTRARQIAVEEALADLKGMTLTVIDGELPKEHIAARNITFQEFSMPGMENSTQRYDAKEKAPAIEKEGRVYGRAAEEYVPPAKWVAVALVMVLALVCVAFTRKAG